MARTTQGGLIRLAVQVTPAQWASLVAIQVREGDQSLSHSFRRVVDRGIADWNLTRGHVPTVAMPSDGPSLEDIAEPTASASAVTGPSWLRGRPIAAAAVAPEGAA